MIKEAKNKKSLIAIGAAVFVIAIIGGAIAANNTIFNFANQFSLGYFSTEFSEDFESPDAWKPCDKTDKIVTVKNTGNVDAKVRIGLEETWESATGAQLGLMIDNLKLAEIEFSNANDWELTEGYYYYKNILGPGQSVEFMKSVTFNCQADFGENTVIDGDGSIADQTVNPYNGASYHLTLTGQVMEDKEGLSWDEAFGWAEPKSFVALGSDFNSKWNDVKNGRELRAFKRSKVLPGESDLPCNTSSDVGSYCYPAMTTIQAENETIPAYLWYNYDEKALYWYSVADAATFPYTSLGGFFNGWFFNYRPDDISGLEYFDMRNVTSMGGFFYGNYIPSADVMMAITHWNLTGVMSWGGAFNSANQYGNYNFTDDYMKVIENWKVGKVHGLGGMISGNNRITNLDGFKKWDTSEITDMSGLFYNVPNLSDISGICNWNVDNVTNLAGLFQYDYNLRDISCLSNWNVSNNTSFGSTFYGTKISDLTPIQNWDVSNVQSFWYMFQGDYELSDISPLAGWSVGNSVGFQNMFYGTAVSDVSPLAGWDVSKSENFNEMFSGTSVTDATSLNNWTVSGTATKTDMFPSGATTPSWY